MVPADIDASLRSGEPAMESLEDGFSPPQPQDHEAQATSQPPQSPAPALGAKSPF
jgi:hypothetical protein